MKSSVTIGTPIEMDIVSVEVLNRTVQDTIVSAGYVYVNQNIKSSKILVHKPGIRAMAIWHRNRDISSESANETMKSMTTVIDGQIYQGRPATIEELASYEAMFYKELEDTVLVALGEKILDDSLEYVASRYVYASERELYLSYWSGDWDAHFHFLAVFEKISKPK